MVSASKEEGKGTQGLGSLGPQRELKGPGNGVMVSASKEEGKGTQGLGPLGPQRELKEPGNGVMVSASKEEGKGTQGLGSLGPQHFEPPYVSLCTLPIEEHYVTFLQEL
jgi:hypothetical protein